jgi:hypothetical protein
MEKTEMQSRLCKKFGNPARNCRIRNFRITPNISYKDDNHVYTLDRRSEPREGLMWEGTITRGVTTSSSAKSARSTTITLENEETRVQQTDTGPTISLKDARMSIQESHQVRTLSEVHDSVGDLEPREIGDSGEGRWDEKNCVTKETSQLTVRFS